MLFAALALLRAADLQRTRNKRSQNECEGRALARLQRRSS
jgi:hypothetical protein